LGIIQWSNNWVKSCFTNTETSAIKPIFSEGHYPKLLIFTSWQFATISDLNKLEIQDGRHQKMDFFQKIIKNEPHTLKTRVIHLNICFVANELIYGVIFVI
jgi:hypothetical protein